MQYVLLLYHILLGACLHRIFLWLVARPPAPRTQTANDILAKHAYDNAARFTRRQRDAVARLWNSIREQQVRRKQGKSVSGKLDVNAFERLQEKYSREKISIRRSVGGAGERRATQWLG